MVSSSHSPLPPGYCNHLLLGVEARTQDYGQYTLDQYTGYCRIDSMERTGRVKVDSGMVVVIFICLMYIVLVFGLLFYVKNDWCELLFKNMTVGTGMNNTYLFSFRQAR